MTCSRTRRWSRRLRPLSIATTCSTARAAIPEEQRHVILFDRVDTTATTWLGLTLACAQCHDHKYDPITQRDYYSKFDAVEHAAYAVVCLGILNLDEALTKP